MRKLLASLGLAASLMSGLAVMAPAAEAYTYTDLKNAAIAVAGETVGGGKYSYYKGKYPTALNWTNDGCSVPSYILVASPAMYGVLRAYGGVFEASCDRHDFGYRNFGSNTSTPGVHRKFDPTRTRKNAIDSKFYYNMKVQCDRKYGTYDPRRAACKGAAGTFYTAVSRYADKAFFG